MLRQFLLALAASCVISTPVSASSSDAATALQSVLGAQHRQASSARDGYRHPAETLAFFEVQPEMTVVEIWPGSGGWYTEILAPWLRNEGTFYAAQFDVSVPGYYQRSVEAFRDKLNAAPWLYDQVQVTTFSPPALLEIAPAGTADRVLTFRNVHNWYMRGGGEEKVLAAFSAFFKALKPGGMLGVVDHRLPESRPAADMEASGYMHQSFVIAMAERAGFKLVASSEINANPNDNADHPNGVWSLPPTLRGGDEQRDKWLAIGESDRMTLKFIKP
ncbi:class I SAM-dependent methyltransferase [Pseudomaricurvus sp. HS19]|uniref:class I SAM-dependent methyltransferase n=1 Tax=Pseudomaricurvus sp. HS19 TaxID=2692626 RepID=UPI00136B867A|nr:class I SAM-dependent methyltransferase [Pseudomaricurvus sp. HS19]MYM64461.1 methyltransferase [Pseudomaricurvus sp. HS19]